MYTCSNVMKKLSADNYSFMSKCWKLIVWHAVFSWQDTQVFISFTVWSCTPRIKYYLNSSKNWINILTLQGGPPPKQHQSRCIQHVCMHSDWQYEAMSVPAHEQRASSPSCMCCSTSWCWRLASRRVEVLQVVMCLCLSCGLHLCPVVAKLFIVRLFFCAIGIHAVLPDYFIHPELCQFAGTLHAPLAIAIQCAPSPICGVLHVSHLLALFSCLVLPYHSALFCWDVVYCALWTFGDMLHLHVLPMCISCPNTVFCDRCTIAWIYALTVHNILSSVHHKLDVFVAYLLYSVLWVPLLHSLVPVGGSCMLSAQLVIGCTYVFCLKLFTVYML